MYIMEPHIQWKLKRFNLCISWITLAVFICQQIQSSASQQTCASNEFQCHDNSPCLPDAFKCDDWDDCDDFSDESALTCCEDANHFHCGAYACIPQSAVCDVVNDCGDGREELKCPQPDMIFVTDIGNNAPKILKGPIKTLELEEIPLRDLRQPVGIDFDSVEQKVYWSDLTTRTINRANIDGSDQEEIVESSLIVPDDLALDTNKRWLFWTDRGSNKIEKANLDGSRRQVVIDDNLDEPRAIVADMDESRLFWTDRGESNPMIERANMDGGQRVALITTDIVHPNGLTIDTAGKLLYWCDAYLNRIERADLNGQGRVIMSAIPGDIHPFDIGFYNDALYWSDEDLRNLMKMNIDPRKNPSAVGDAIFNRAQGLHVHIYKQDVLDECSSSPCSNGQCRDGLNGYTCQCNAGYTGTRCNTNINGCNSIPCARGQCVDGVIGYTCKCNTGWTGTNCNIYGCASSPCGRGNCYASDNDNGYTCVCFAGWTGTNCDEDIDECSSNPCDNGQCLDAVSRYQCKCQAGWTGTHCEKQGCDSNSCVNGDCVFENNYICQCDDGWTGYNCDIRVTCPILQPPLNGKVEPSICQFDTSYPGLTCRYSCNDARFILNGPQSQKCMATGSWSDEGVTSSCEEDNTPPVFQTECPLDLMNVTVQKPCLDEIAIYVNLPTPIDNSGFIPQVTPRIPYDALLNIGSHEQLFIATDTAGNVAECRVYIMVHELTCEPLPPTPTNGYIDTSICDNFYNKVTTYKCNDGYELVGNSTLTCGEDGKWKWRDEDGEWRQDAPECEEIRCNPLTIPTHGSAHCYPDTYIMNVTASLGMSCFIFCNGQFKLYPPESRAVKCIKDGTKGSWTVDLTGAVCEDLNAPEFETCPESRTVNLPADSSVASVTWLTPVALHLGQRVMVVASGFTSPAILEPGTHRVVYGADNPYGGETGYCVFDVTVSDIHAPTFNCPTEPVTIASSVIPVAVTWEEPRVTDNVGVANLTRRYTDSVGNSHKYSTLPFMLNSYDTVTVKYTALDDAGNRAECSFEVEPTNSLTCSCPTMNKPPNCDLLCEGSDCKNCTINCTSEAVQLNTRFNNAECQPRGVKHRKPPSKYADKGKHLIKDVGVVESKEDRNPQMAACATVNSSAAVNVSREVVIVLNGTAEEDCSQQLSDNITKTMTDGANAKFQTKCQSDSMSTCMVYIDEVECSDKSDSKRRTRQADSGMKLKVKFRLTAERSNSDDIAVVDNAMSITVSELLPKGGVVLQNQNGQDNIFDIESEESGPVKANCDYRQGAAGVRCVPCALGTSYDLVRRECTPCKIGKYQDEEGWLVCKPCPQDPVGTTTAGTGSYNVTHCEAACPFGQYALLGLKPCNLCPIGTFQPEEGKRGCEPCPVGTFQPEEGKRGCEPCPVGTFQPEEGKRGCEPCPDGGTTPSIGATSVLQCLE